MTKSGRVSIVLRPDYKGLLLFISGECTLFLISLSVFLVEMEKNAYARLVIHTMPQRLL